MKSLRVALTAAGALAALVGGAETATWGLSPLSASMIASAPQIVASGGSPVDHGEALGDDRIAYHASAAPMQSEQAPVVYDPPPEPPTQADTDGPRYVDDALASPSTTPPPAGEETAANASPFADRPSEAFLEPNSEGPTGGGLLSALSPD